MSTPNHIDDLILKYFSRSISKAEFLQLQEWIKIPGNKAYFKDVQKIWECRNDVDQDAAWRSFNDRRKESLNQHRVLTLAWIRPVLGYAAGILVVASLAFLLYWYSRPTIHMASIDGDAICAVKEVTLQMDDGSKHTLIKEDQKRLLAGDGTKIEKKLGDKLVYKDTIVSSPVVHYNSISIPHGKRFTLQLADGTQVWLNSGSHLRYPARFIGKTRKVELVGEAFFDVAHDKKHPFIVETGGLHLQVLGTSFNVSSYSTDEYVNTTLVEGVVRLYPSVSDVEKAMVLKPNHMAKFRKVDRDIQVKEVDPSTYIAWKEERFIFDSEKFCDMRQRLERWYGVKIKNFVLGLEEEHFSGDFSNKKIEDVLTAFQAMYPFQWKRQGDTLLITPTTH